MQGSLSQVPLPEVLQFISMGKPSGMLTLRRGNNEITLYIHGGRIINSSSLERRRRLGDLLVHRGLLKRSELSRLLNLQKTVESDKRLGTILVERDIVSEETIRETLRLQLEEEIWSLFGWNEGEFKFETVSEDRLGDAIVQIDIEPLILEGTRRNDEWQKIQTIITGDDVVLTVAPVPDNFQRDLKLRPQEWRVLSQVNGTFTVRAIVNRSNMGRFEVHRILSQFVKSGLVKVRTEITPRESGFLPADDPENGRQPAAVSEKPKSGGLLSSFMGGKRDKGASRLADSMEFASPIGMIAFFTNELCARLIEAKEYHKADGDEELLQSMWADLVQTYTKADLISVRKNRVDTRHIETFFGNCEFAEYIDECYEDALEGLMSLLQGSFRVFAQRVGERTASRIVRELLDEVGARCQVKFRGPFPIVERVQNVLRLAA